MTGNGNNTNGQCSDCGEDNAEYCHYIGLTLCQECIRNRCTATKEENNITNNYTANNNSITLAYQNITNPPWLLTTDYQTQNTSDNGTNINFTTNYTTFITNNITQNLS